MSDQFNLENLNRDYTPTNQEVMKLYVFAASEEFELPIEAIEGELDHLFIMPEWLRSGEMLYAIVNTNDRDEPNEEYPHGKLAPPIANCIYHGRDDDEQDYWVVELRDGANLAIVDTGEEYVTMKRAPD